MPARPIGPQPPGPHALFAVHSLVVPVLAGIVLTATAGSRFGRGIPLAFVLRMVVSRAVVEGIVVAAVSGAAVALCRTRYADRRVLMAASVAAGLCAGCLQAFLGTYGMVVPMVGHPPDLVVTAMVTSAAGSMLGLAAKGRMAAWRDDLVRAGDGVSGWWRRFGRSRSVDTTTRTTGPVAVFIAFLLAGPLLGLLDMLAIGLGHIVAAPFAASRASGMPTLGEVVFLSVALPLGAYFIGGVSAATCGACVAICASRGLGRWVLVLVSVPAALAGDMVSRMSLPRGLLEIPGAWLTDHACLSVWASVVLTAYLVRRAGDPPGMHPAVRHPSTAGCAG